MADETLLNKASTIERCVARIREEYDKDPTTFADDFTRQDAAILNLLRACETCIDIGQILVRRHRLGLPRSSRDVFMLLGTAGLIPPDLASGLQRMIGFRNIAVHDYAALEIPILIHVIEKHLNDFLSFGRIALQHGDNSHTNGLERSRGCTVKQALSALISQVEEPRRLTLEALDDVQMGEVINHHAVQAWADSLDTEDPWPLPR